MPAVAGRIDGNDVGLAIVHARQPAKIPLRELTGALVFGHFVNVHQVSCRWL